MIEQIRKNMFDYIERFFPKHLIKSYLAGYIKTQIGYDYDLCLEMAEIYYDRFLPEYFGNKSPYYNFS